MCLQSNSKLKKKSPHALRASHYICFFILKFYPLDRAAVCNIFRCVFFFLKVRFKYKIFFVLISKLRGGLQIYSKANLITIKTIYKHSLGITSERVITYKYSEIMENNVISTGPTLIKHYLLSPEKT